jgi:hypothetical protein
VGDDFSHRSAERATVLEVDVRTRSTPAPGFRLVLLAIFFVMALTADTRIASAAPGGAEQVAAPPPAAGETPFDRQGMWIWYVDRSDGGSVGQIVARAQGAGIGTLYIKAGDAGHVWSQFSKALVGALRRGGLDVCAWQFVYGDSPIAEAKVGAAAVRRGADCLAIDAEGSYEGKYAAADSFIRALRGRVGPTFPLSLAAFPYVDYHPSFPYSVFFGPEGATVNQPQSGCQALGAPLVGPVLGYRPIASHPVLKRGSEADLVVWAQEHLQTAIQPQLPITGIFGKQTRAAVRAFQESQGLPVDGVLGTTTWGALLNFDPVRPRWAGRRAKRGGGATASRAFPARRPLSASLPAKAYEIDPGPAP